MVYRKGRNAVIRNIKNIPGWRTNRRIIIFESDDWGSIRMPSLTVFKKLEKLGVDLRSMDAERFNLNDSLATSTDLEKLFDVLTGVKDKNGNYAVFTPVSIIANPDFNKIKLSGYSEYYYEPFTETLKKYPGCENSFNLWLEGIKNKIFIPESHGREHLNIAAWLKLLRLGDRNALLAFKEGMWGFVPDQKVYPGLDFQAAFLLFDPQEVEIHMKIIKEGMDMFEKLFGYRAVYFVPPNGHFNNILNKTLYENGISFRCLGQIQPETIGFGKYRNTLNWLGKRDKNYIMYITRNCSFEPSISNRNWIDSCLKEISTAFSWNKPAVISSHRVNYIGALNPINRDNGLRQLKELLKEIVNRWPEVEFLNTSKLCKLIQDKFYRPYKNEISNFND
jgi:hypothetical protein